MRLRKHFAFLMLIKAKNLGVLTVIKVVDCELFYSLNEQMKWAVASNQIKFIYIALRTSADISKCCTETQPKTPNSKQCRCRSTVHGAYSCTSTLTYASMQSYLWGVWLSVSYCWPPIPWDWMSFQCTACYSFYLMPFARLGKNTNNVPFGTLTSREHKNKRTLVFLFNLIGWTCAFATVL